MYHKPDLLTLAIAFYSSVAPRYVEPLLKWEVFAMNRPAEEQPNLREELARATSDDVECLAKAYIYYSALAEHAEKFSLACHYARSASTLGEGGRAYFGLLLRTGHYEQLVAETRSDSPQRDLFKIYTDEQINRRLVRFVHRHLEGDPTFRVFQLAWELRHENPDFYEEVGQAYVTHALKTYDFELLRLMMFSYGFRPEREDLHACVTKLVETVPLLPVMDESGQGDVITLAHFLRQFELRDTFGSELANRVYAGNFSFTVCMRVADGLGYTMGVEKLRVVLDRLEDDGAEQSIDIALILNRLARLGEEVEQDKLICAIEHARDAAAQLLQADRFISFENQLMELKPEREPVPLAILHRLHGRLRPKSRLASREPQERIGAMLAKRLRKRD